MEVYTTSQSFRIHASHPFCPTNLEAHTETVKQSFLGLLTIANVLRRWRLICINGIRSNTFNGRCKHEEADFYECAKDTDQ